MKFYPITRSYTINIPVEGGTNQIQYNDNGVTRKVYAGKEEFPGNNRTGMYHKDGDPQLSVSPAEHSWITVSLGSVDETNTAAPVMYNAQVNLGDEARSVDVTLNGNTAVTFTLNQTYTPRLMYMNKNSSPKYGDWIECMRINKGIKIFSLAAPLTSTTDVSIFNGKSGNTYNPITIEIQPFRNMNVSFGFTQDDTLNTLITSGYTLTTVGGNTSFFNVDGNNTVKYQNGYFSFSTNNQNSWTKKLGAGGGGIGDIVDVSAHYKFSGSNLPLIDIYISNMLSYTLITSFDLVLKCEYCSSPGNNIFIESVKINSESGVVRTAAWPVTLNGTLTLQNIKPTWNPNIEFRFRKAGAYSENVNSAYIPLESNPPYNKYSFSITNINGDPSKYAELSIINSVDGTNLFYFFGTGDNRLYVQIKQDTDHINKIMIYTTYVTAENIYEFDPAQSALGISLQLPTNTYRFSNEFGSDGKTLNIGLVEELN